MCHDLNKTICRHGATGRGPSRSRVERLVPPSTSFPREAEFDTEPLIMFAPTLLPSSPLAERDFAELSIFALSCNETILTVEVNVTFIGKGMDLDIDPAIPPLLDEVTARVSALDGSNFATFATRVDNYRRLGNFSINYFETSVIDHFFTLFTTSRYAVATADLASRLRASRVADDIRFQNNLIHAQELGQARRWPLRVI